MFKFWVEDETGKISEYELTDRNSYEEAYADVEQYAIEDGFYHPIIELID